MNIKNMNIQYVTSLGALAAALLSPSMANASFLLDTGTPGGSTQPARGRFCSGYGPES